MIVLFYLMLSCGIPELEKESDILWLRKHLMVYSRDGAVSGCVVGMLTCTFGGV